MKKIILVLFMIISVFSFSDSLWNKVNANSSIYSTKKILKTGDIVTITVLENPTMTVSDNLADYSGASFNTISSIFKTIGGIDLKNFLPISSTTPSEIKAGTKKSSSTGQATVRMSITARIIGEEGKLLKLRGEKEIKVGREKKKMIIEGFLSPDNVSTEGIIESSKIANVRIWYDGSIIFQQDPNEQTWVGWILSGISNLFF